MDSVIVRDPDDAEKEIRLDSNLNDHLDNRQKRINDFNNKLSRKKIAGIFSLMILIIAAGYLIFDIDEGAEKIIAQKSVKASFDSNSKEIESDVTVIEKEIKENGVKSKRIDVKIDPEEDTGFEEIELQDVRSGIKELKFEKLDEKEFNKKIEDNVINDKENGLAKNVFAVDPSKVNFTKGTIKVKAKGSYLYKCKDWNFEKQECPEFSVECTGPKDDRECVEYGGWKKLKKVIPGQEYLIEITPDDPGFAEYDLEYTAPYCSDGESPCIADSADLRCRDSVSDGNGPEPNSPNTIDDCTDGSAIYADPSCGGDESVENITITDLDNDNFRPGDTIRVEAWVHCWDDGSEDNINLIYASNASDPDWVVKDYISSCSVSGYHNVVFDNITLDDVEGDHAIRVLIEYQGSTSTTCSDGDYSDNDDLVFRVEEEQTDEQDYDILGETGEISVSNHESVIVEFQNEYSSVPIVIATPVTQNAGSSDDDSALIPVIEAINNTHVIFNLCQDNGQTTCDTTVVEERIHYFVFDTDKELPSWIAIGKEESVDTDGSDTQINFGKNFENVPYVFTQAQTNNQGNYISAVAWADDITTSQANIIGCTHRGTANSCDSSTPSESFAWVAIDVQNVNFSSFVNFQYGEEGISSSSWTDVDWNSNYSSARIMVTQNDDNGGQDPQYAWARYIDTSDPEFRYCEQDTADDCDSHTSEKVVWMTMEHGLITIGEGLPADTTIPNSVTNLNSQSAGKTWIYWNWTNPSDSDFNSSIIYLDGINVDNTTDNFYNMTGLSPGTDYIITVHTKDHTENVNDTDVNSTVSTLLSNYPPNVDSLKINSTTGANLTYDNITAYATTSDADGDDVKNIYDWRVNGTSISVYDIPFEGHGGDENIVTHDYSGNNTELNVIGAYWNSSGGYDNKGAYEFDGTGNYIEDPSGGSQLNDLDAFTLSLWAKSDLTNTDNGMVFTHTPDGTDSGITIRYDASGANGGGTNLIKAGVTVGTTDMQIESSNDAQTTDWQHLVLVWENGKQLKLYIDGELDTPTANSEAESGMLSQTTRFLIGVGGKDALNSSGWDGMIDEVKLYRRALSYEQISALYENRTDLIVSQETSAGDIWSCEITPNDFKEDGSTLQSNAVKIISEDLVTLNETITNSLGMPVDTKMTITDQENNTVYESNGTLHHTSIKKGIYDIRIMPIGHIVKEVTFSDYNISDNLFDIVDICSGNEEFLFSINPKLNNTNMTVVASGNPAEKGYRILEKCVDWNYSAGTCYGEWTPYTALNSEGLYNFTMDSVDPGFRETISQCVAEEYSSKGNWNSVCDGTYPGACGSDGNLLSCDDGYTETKNSFNFLGRWYAGIQVQEYNESIEDCQEIDKVEVCYEWWRSNNNPYDCDISIDADNDDSWTPVTTSCPGTIENPGVTCVDVTSDESWNCDNFFDENGTRARIKSEATSDDFLRTVTYNWDVLYFNVSYKRKSPNITITYPESGKTYNSRDIFFRTEITGNGIDSCWYNLNDNENVSFDCEIANITAVEGANHLKVYSNNTDGLTGSSEISFDVNTSVSLVIDITSPANGSVRTASSPKINLFAIDSKYSEINYSLYVYFENSTLYAEANKGILQNDTELELTLDPALTLEGSSTTYKIIANATDEEGNTAESSVLYYTLTLPAVELISPEINYWDNDGDISFEFRVYDGAFPNISCSLYLDDILNQTKDDVETNGTLTSFDVQGIKDGSDLEWKVECIDAAENDGYDLRTFNVDSTSPVVNWIDSFPENVETGDHVNITANVTDNIGLKEVIVNISGSRYYMEKAYGDIFYYTYHTMASGITEYSIEAYDNLDHSDIMEGNFSVIDIDEGIIMTWVVSEKETDKKDNSIGQTNEKNNNMNFVKNTAGKIYAFIFG